MRIQQTKPRGAGPGRILVLLGFALGIASLCPAAPVPAPKPIEDDPPPPGALARLGSSRLRHTWTVAAVSFSGDGTLLASCGQETSGGGSSAVRIWEVPSGREVRCIWLGHWFSGGRATRVALSPDGKLVAWSGPGSDGVAVADVATGRVIDNLHKPDGPVKDAPAQPFAFSADSKTLATGGADGTLRIWDLTNGKETIQAKVGAFDRCVFSPDGKTLAVAGGRFAGLRLIDIAPDRPTTGKTLAFPIVRPAPHCFAFSPDSALLAGGDDNLVRVWDVAAGKELRRIPWEGKSAFALGFSLDSQALTAVSRDGHIRTWTTATGKETRTFELPFNVGDRDPDGRLALSPARRWLAVAPPDKGIHLMDLTAGREVPIASTRPSATYTTGYAFSPDSKYLVTPSNEDRLLVWEARTGRLVRQGTEDGRSVCWIAVTPDGKQVLTLSYDRQWAAKVRLDEWDFATCKRLRQCELGISPGRVALSPDGKFLICGENNDSRYRMHPSGDLVLIDRATGKQVRHFDDGKPSAAQALACSADGSKLATISGQGTIRVWDAGTGKLLRTMETGGSQGLSSELRFIEGDRTLVSLSIRYGDGGHQVSRLAEWDVATGKEKKVRDGPRNLGWCHLLSPDGKQLAWAGGAYGEQREEVEVWDVSAGSAAWRFNGLRGGPTFLLFSPDGRTLASGSAEETVLIWDVPRP
jgi:WD40 repeat protein